MIFHRISFLQESPDKRKASFTFYQPINRRNRLSISLRILSLSRINGKGETESRRKSESERRKLCGSRRWMIDAAGKSGSRWDREGGRSGRGVGAPTPPSTPHSPLTGWENKSSRDDLDDRTAIGPRDRPIIGGGSSEFRLSRSHRHAIAHGALSTIETGDVIES